MSSAIATIQPAQTALTIPDARREVIRNVFAPGATDDEFDVFVSICNRVRLDPARKQIYFFKNKGVMSTVTGIDGFRAVAERTGLYEGQAKHMWCGEDGVWKDVWLDRNNPPEACMVGVFKKGFREPLFAVATLNSYGKFAGGNLTGNWSYMADVMLSKCAEALALRRAFPDDLGGLYTQDELDHTDIAQASSAPADAQQQEKPKPAAAKSGGVAAAKNKVAAAKNANKPPEPTLESVKAFIAGAKTLNEMERGVAAQTRGLSDGDKAALRPVFKARKAELQKLEAAEPPHDNHGEVVDAEFDYGPPPMESDPFGDIERNEAGARG
jgi:phage recombination protein Bet